MIGRIVKSRYKITDRLGKGAMGTVYLAADLQNDKQEVALKIISSELAIEPEMLKRFKHEGEALRQLKHPNIVGFIDAFQYEETHVIVMEYVSGGSLFEVLKEGSLPIERVRQFGLDLCDALIRAHRLNIIHRDIKPENILIDENDSPKLADFGVARLNEGTRMTRSGMQVGTPYYMAPEAWKGEKLDGQADIWSLGVVLFEMLSGKVPFDGDTAASVMTKVLTQSLPDLKKLRTDTPPDMVNIVNQMLTSEKKQRYQTFREVAVDLERSQKTHPAKAGLSATKIINIAQQLNPQIQNTKHKSEKQTSFIKKEKAGKETGHPTHSLNIDPLYKERNIKANSNRTQANSKRRRSFVYVIDHEGVPLYNFLPTSDNWTVWLKKNSKLQIVDEMKDVMLSIGKYGHFIEVIDENKNRGFVPALSVSFNIYRA